jgi:GAF domain-containing protein/predicted Ser/Thr protein kinase
VVLASLTLALGAFALQALVVRPYLWPAGAGITVSGDLVLTRLAEVPLVPRIRPPDLRSLDPITITRVNPASEAARLGAAVGTRVSDRLTVDSALRMWRDAYVAGPTARVEVIDQAAQRPLSWEPQPVWRVDSQTRDGWLRQHVTALLQTAGFLAGAILLLVLGSRGTTATLMTLSMIFTAIANGGSLFGAEFTIPVAAVPLLVFGWIATALSFPLIGLAVLHFPTRAAILDRHRWIPMALCALPAPVFIVSMTAAAFLLGFDAALAPLAWFSSHPWLFDASFALGLAANVLIVVEGIHRYRTSVDPGERRRIQIVVYTGVPSVFAYAIKAGVPLATSIAGRPMELPWVAEAILQSIVLLPAFALPYAVAVKHVFSPRTVLRRSLQYALARRTLSVLVLLPIAALIISLITQRDRPLGEIIVGQPLFSIVSVALIALGLRYRDQAQRALDRKFFRAEYDAREILVALANRVPLENDPTNLVALVIRSIDEALHPESIAVLAGEDARLEVLSSVRTTVEPLPRESGLATLLRWSDEPLEVFLDDERSPAARLPAADRAWLAASQASLLVPIFAGTSDPLPAGQGASGGATGTRALIGVIGLGQKRSEEPYTAEDRKLLSGIAAQMSVALDLSRLRRRASSATAAPLTPTLTPTMAVSTPPLGIPALAMCPACRRCYEYTSVLAPDGAARCPDDRSVLQPVIGMPVTVDGKYRVDAVVGRGGMGAVFRARDLRLERDVAVKVVRADLVNDADSRSRFQREAQIVARLQHPAIVTVFDYGRLPDGAAFLVMEFVRGEDLRHLLRREKTLAVNRAIDLVTGIALGVDAAHRAGVLHRDLKPENILLPEGGGSPKVLDFGIAKITDASSTAMATHGATVVGTPAYMAPEQLRGEAVDARADVYSLAVLTYEALTGRLPFGTGSFVDVAVKQAEGWDRIVFDGMPSAIASTLRRALSLTRDGRPATAAAFADELKLP